MRDVADVAVGHHDALEPHHALHLGAHGVGGVLRLDLAEHARDGHAAARTIRPAAGAAAEAGPETGTLARADARSRARSCTATGAGALRNGRRALATIAPGSGCSAAAIGLAGMLRSSSGLTSSGRRLGFGSALDRNGDLFLAGQFGLLRWLRRLVATAATAAPGPRLGNPHDVLQRDLGRETATGRRGHSASP